MNDTGYHYIIDFKVRCGNILKDPDALKSVFTDVLRGFSIVAYDHFKFEEEGEGVTGFFLLSESHCSYHTYPENDYIAVDVFTCGTDPGDVAGELARKLDAISYCQHFLKRGSATINSPFSTDNVVSLAA